MNEDRQTEKNGRAKAGAALGIRAEQPEGAGAAPAVSMDDVHRCVEAERSRSRRVLVLSSATTLFAMMVILVLSIWLGVTLLTKVQNAESAVAVATDQAAAARSELAGVSASVGSLGEQDKALARTLAEQVGDRDEEKAKLRGDLTGLRDWLESRVGQRDEDVTAIAVRMREVEAASAERDKQVLALAEQLVSLRRAATTTQATGDVAVVTVPTADRITVPVPPPDAPPATSPVPDSAVFATVSIPQFTEKDVAPTPPENRPDREVITLAFPNGDRYEGDMVDGLFHGYGALTHGNGDRYEGDFKDDSMHGKGIFVHANGNRFVGEFDRGQRHGRGFLFFANGDVYRGEFKEGARTGRGVYAFKAGERYEGEFLDGSRHGIGRYIYPSGDEFRGHFVKGMKEGPGICIYANNMRVRGFWRADVLDKREEPAPQPTP